MNSVRDEPSNLKAERAVLGSCLVNSNALSTVLSELTAEDFYSDTHRALFVAIEAAGRDNGRVDEVVLTPYLPESMNVRHALYELVESVPTAANTGRYAALVKDASRARRTLDAADRLRQRILSGDHEGAAEAGMVEMEAILRGDNSGDVEDLKEGLEDLATWLHESRTHSGVTGIRTGIPKLDNAVKGLNNKRFYIVAGRPGSGKSLVAGQIALSAARRGHRVLLQSPEMGKAEYLRRMAVSQAGVRAEKVQDGEHTQGEESAILRAATEIVQLPLTIDDFGTQTLSRVRRNVVRYKPDLLIVDYLQRLMPDDRRSSRYDQVSQMSFDLDRIKKDFDIPVLAAAQLNRSVEQRQDKHPMLSDLRDSGGLEQDADAIVMLYKPSMYSDEEPDDVIEMAVEKNRSGPLYQTRVSLDKSLWIVAKHQFGSEVAS